MNSPRLVGWYGLTVFLLCSGLSSPLLQAQESTDSMTALLAKANTAYDHGDYQQALTAYRLVLEQGGAHGAVYYNCANCYFQLQQLGPAILYYEKAATLLPRDEDIKANLELARTMTQDKLEEPKLGPVTKVVTCIYRSFNQWELFITALIFYSAAALCFTAAIIMFRSARRGLLVWIGAVLLIPTLIIGVSLLAQLYNSHYHPQAIVLESEVNARSGPGTDFTVLFTIHEGAKVYVRGERAGWIQILLANGLSGMVPQETVSRI